MPRPIDPEVLRATALDVLVQMQQFNGTHPTATFTEIEDAVEGALAGLRQALLTQSVQGHPLADFRRTAQPPVCPLCGAALQANGQHERQVVTQGEVVVSIARTRGRCSACGLELFPPGRATGVAARTPQSPTAAGRDVAGHGAALWAGTSGAADPEPGDDLTQ